MTLTPDQQALLQLVLDRGQSYEDLTALLGGSEAEVRSRARMALTRLGGADPDRSVSLTDYLLGQADPIGRADAVRHLRDDPEELELVSTLVARLRELYPDAELPRLPGEPRTGPIVQRPAFPRLRRRREAPAPPAREVEAPAPARPPLSSRQARLLVALGSGAVILVAIVLAVTGAFGGEDDDAGALTDAPGLSEEATRVSLTAPAEGPVPEASGTAVFSTATTEQPFVELNLSGLERLRNQQAYVLWLRIDEGNAIPITPFQAEANGTYRQRIALSDVQVAAAPEAQTVSISLADAEELLRDVTRAQQEAHIVLPYRGRTVLEGEIPRSSDG